MGSTHVFVVVVILLLGPTSGTFQALLLLLPNGEGQSTSGIQRNSSFHFCPHPTNLLLLVHTLRYPPCQASSVLCKSGLWVSAS